ncbi:hypothetical protein Misp02_39710 [Microtetraspora sp. NBRC 16547]|nr:hypothetical protein Misp02_39710 [Microtetraspora sp. NBRC 16547]
MTRIERLVTRGTFRLDGGTWDVDNNVWPLGDDDQVLVIDAAHGDDTGIGAEAPQLEDWIRRGH